MKIIVSCILCALLSTVAVAQQRIISLAPSLTQNLYLLGLDNNVVGYTSYCEEAVHGNKEIVASAIKVNLEKVAVLRPDMVLTTTLTPPETIEQIESFGIKVMVYKSPESYESICEQFFDIAEKTNTQASAETIISECNDRINVIKESRKNKKSLRIFFQIGTNPLYCVSPKTFMDDYITFCHGKNVVSTPQCGAVSRESIIVSDPEVIFITAMGIKGEDEQGTWESYKDLSATSSSSIYLLDSNKACSPTPITFVETLETMINYIESNNK